MESNFLIKRIQDFKLNSYKIIDNGNLPNTLIIKYQSEIDSSYSFQSSYIFGSKLEDIIVMFNFKFSPDSERALDNSDSKNCDFAYLSWSRPPLGPCTIWVGTLEFQIVVINILDSNRSPAAHTQHISMKSKSLLRLCRCQKYIWPLQAIFWHSQSMGRGSQHPDGSRVLDWF